MTQNLDLFQYPGSIPESYTAFFLAERLRANKTLLHVTPHEQQAQALKQILEFLNPKLQVIFFPAWDCLPYDRVSPHLDVMAARLEVMHLLSQKPTDSRIVLITAPALLQKIPALEIFQGKQKNYIQGESIPRDTLLDHLISLGYHRQGTVRESGEFAVRGGLMDVFPAGAPSPLRLDFFGDTLETIRCFDPVSQLSGKSQENFTLKPTSEVVLSPESIRLFREGYRALFPEKNTSTEDPLYQAISQGNPYPGMEHWTPLFYPQMHPLWTLLTCESLTLDHKVPQILTEFYEQVQDHYQARLDFLHFEEKSQGLPYHPLSPSKLYLSPDEVLSALQSYNPVVLSPFSQEESPHVKAAVSFLQARKNPEIPLFQAVADHLKSLSKQRILLSGWTEGSVNRLTHLLKDHGFEALTPLQTGEDLKALPFGRVGTAVLPLRQGFQTADLCVLTEEDILGERLGQSSRKRKARQLLPEVSPFEEGDFVVHRDHGIGQYSGLETLYVDRIPHDCLLLLYADGDKLFVPVENIDNLSRYGAKDSTAALDKLGTAQWQLRKSKVKKRIQVIAAHLIKLAAERALEEGMVLDEPGEEFATFCARFPYVETEDQERAIAATLADLASGQPMDRLICGDVGFGKTEIALRAAYVVAASGAQVAIIVPTTLLARQHTQNFQNRFEGTGFRVAQLSRFVSQKEALQTKKDLMEGKISLVIATHSLLAASVQFKNLGLLVVDEEQHFGVAQKEKLKNLKKNVHVLTLTATPIPRTLQMALSGVREMSLITTPPLDRLAVRTFVLPFDGMVVREAVLREKNRGGQTFYICPRIEELEKVRERLTRLIPEARIDVAHGQLSPTQLEKVMERFYEHATDILLSTNIVESGIDIPTANTLIIHRADLFGLAQLYQLRGRVGRGKVRGYAYLTLAAGGIPSATALRRLEVLQSLDYLGAGFTVASHDMDIRGAGNLVGEQQSGHIREVGVELYQHLLEEAIQELKNDSNQLSSEKWSPQISLHTPILIPETYVTDLNLRLGLYRRLGDIETPEGIHQIAAELVDRFGSLPHEVDNLLAILELKLLCKKAHIDKLTIGEKGVVFCFYQNTFPQPARLIAWMGRQQEKVRLRPDQKLVWNQAISSKQEDLKKLQRFLEEICHLLD